MVGKGMQKLKNGLCQGTRKDLVAILVFPSPQPFIEFITIVGSSSFLWFRSTLLPCYRHREGKSLATRGDFFCRSKVDFVHTCLKLHRFSCAAIPWKSARAFLWYQVPFLVWASILMTAVLQSKSIAVRRPCTCPFLIGVPMDIRKLLCFHNILKSWMIPKAYRLSVGLWTVLSIRGVLGEGTELCLLGRFSLWEVSSPKYFILGSNSVFVSLEVPFLIFTGWPINGQIRSGLVKGGSS